MNDYLSAVASRLPGSGRLRAGLLDELADGFETAVVEGEAAGLSRSEAICNAETVLGPPGLVAEAIRQELEVRRARRVAWSLLTGMPAVTVLWDLTGTGAETSSVIGVLARIIDASVVAAFLCSAAVLAGFVSRRAGVLCGTLGIATLTVVTACAALMAFVGEPGSGQDGDPYLVAASVTVASWVVLTAVPSLRTGLSVHAQR